MSSDLQSFVLHLILFKGIHLFSLKGEDIKVINLVIEGDKFVASVEEDCCICSVDGCLSIEVEVVVFHNGAI